jgi:hypothetical protein
MILLTSLDQKASACHSSLTIDLWKFCSAIFAWQCAQDVPTSGLILVAKPHEAYYVQGLAGHIGQMEVS